MKAMLLAAGRGTRMQPLTDHTPKPLLKVGGKPLIVWHLERLALAGFKDVVINHAWLGAQIESSLGNGGQWGLNIQYSAETEALETAGGLAKALHFLDEKPFLVMNADVWCDWQPARAFLIQKQLEDNPALLAWLLLVNNPNFHAGGDFFLPLNGVLSCEPVEHHATNQGADINAHFIAHGGVDNIVPRLTFSGIGIYKPHLFESLEPNQPAKLAPLLKHAMTQQRVIGEKYNGQWVDVGTPERLAILNQTKHYTRS
jgi:MurNAc alpha-1-phosphate uridylyltransferase